MDTYATQEIKRQIGYARTTLRRKEREYAEALQERRNHIEALEAELTRREES